MKGLSLINHWMILKKKNISHTPMGEPMMFWKILVYSRKFNIKMNIPYFWSKNFWLALPNSFVGDCFGNLKNVVSGKFWNREEVMTTVIEKFLFQQSQNSFYTFLYWLDYLVVVFVMATPLLEEQKTLTLHFRQTHGLKTSHCNSVLVT